MAGQQLQDLGSVRRPSKGQLVWMDAIINYLTYNFKEQFPTLSLLLRMHNQMLFPEKLGRKTRYITDVSKYNAHVVAGQLGV